MGIQTPVLWYFEIVGFIEGFSYVFLKLCLLSEDVLDVCNDSVNWNMRKTKEEQSIRVNTSNTITIVPKTIVFKQVAFESVNHINIRLSSTFTTRTSLLSYPCSRNRATFLSLSQSP